MAHFAIFGKNRPYFGPEAKILKSKDTFFSSTFKVEEYKVTFFFNNFALWAKIWPFSDKKWLVLPSLEIIGHISVQSRR